MIWICVICGKKYGSPKTTISTWHSDKCDYCGDFTTVTDSRDYGYPKLPEERMMNKKPDES